MKKLDYIDALRGIAIISVLIVHTNEYGDYALPTRIDHIVNEGARGVQLFFLASSFTLYISFKNRIAKEKFPIQNFFLRRFFRIAPMYYLGICYYLMQDGLGSRYWLGDEEKITVSNIVANLTFLHGFNPYWIASIVPGGWSIGVEMTFYMIMPFLFAKVKGLNQAFGFFIVSLVLKLIFQFVLKKIPLIASNRLWEEYLFLYFPSQLPVFFLGIILYFIVIEKESINAISGKSVLAFAGILLSQLSVGSPFILPNHILFAMGFLSLGYALSIYRFSLIVNPIIMYFGKISFSMYLVHFAVLHWLNKVSFDQYYDIALITFFIRFVLVILITTILSTILYNIIEIPFQNLGKKIINRLENQHQLKSVEVKD